MTVYVGGKKQQELYGYNSAVRSYVGDYVYSCPFFLFLHDNDDYYLYHFFFKPEANNFVYMSSVNSYR